jgi:DNA-binding CsgD family transcriptional regulator
MATAVEAHRWGVLRPEAPPSERAEAEDLLGAGLSPREFEIARLTCRGLSNKEIAQVLDISHHTVSTHLRRVFDKLKIKLAAYVAECLANGWHGVRPDLTRAKGAFGRQPAAEGGPAGGSQPRRQSSGLERC